MSAPSTSALLIATLDPLLEGTAFTNGQSGVPPDPVEAALLRPGRSASLTWCAPTPVFRDRHPAARAALDPEHPDGCTDLVVDVDEAGRLVRAELEMLDIGRDLHGRPVEEALPVLAHRLRALLVAPARED
ncbi:hypothetical protein [Nocardioides sp. YIM 152315]|uniref:hypothetical protein n=1 Tax=Nocardioides sp. YIM 152315 TaxID=3031760 RepID=UPI0023D9947B|nr:hypothetical protein [Nocardioides sp. YIM 152315]MDF1603040.1 hypothetical protein [Nocardioides sp. YIM 152315]